MNRAFALEPRRCTGCQACVVACAVEHGSARRQVITTNERRYPGRPVVHVSIACEHCADAPCADCCPAGVYEQDAATGAVLFRPERCMGCRYCSWVCPYDAPRFDAGGEVYKCDFCVERLRAGRDPACVVTCPTDALRIAARDRSHVAAPVRRGPAITLRSEWPLLVFTAIAWLLVAVVAASGMNAIAFLGMGIASIAIAAFHLGKPTRAWRAPLGWRTSWLSREVILYAAFLALGAAWLSGPRRHGALWAAAALGGAGALFAIDRVYGAVRRRAHSAETLLNAAYLGCILAGIVPAAFAVAMLKLYLYFDRRERRSLSAWWAVPRLFAGIVATCAALALGHPAAAAIAAYAGDLIDRAEYYRDVPYFQGTE